jgi:hypothetical protein
MPLDPISLTKVNGADTGLNSICPDRLIVTPLEL